MKRLPDDRQPLVVPAAGKSFPPSCPGSRRSFLPLLDPRAFPPREETSLKTLQLPALCFCCSLLTALGPGLGAADWPQWQGPNRDNVSKETGLLKTWPKDG